MKRSQINQIMREALAFFDHHKYILPPFAKWTPKDWTKKGPEAKAIVAQQMGWDITDFGSGDWLKRGLFLFTVRNGTLDELKKADGKVYAEKIMIVRENQVTPTHFHFQKMEDIINRGGGELVIQLWNADKSEGLADTPVTLSKDGVMVTVPAGGTVTITPGESVTLTQGMYHKFSGAPGKGTVLIGEVSRINDDHLDNRFHEKVGRFPQIEEDEEPLYPLVGDYKKFYKHA